MNSIAAFSASPRVEALHQVLSDQVGSIVDSAIAIQQIAAPTFDEARRAEYVRHQFEQIDGVADITVDALYNVYARLPGSAPQRPALLIAAHTDTVFNAHTNLTMQRQAGRVYGPGIGDNSMGVAALLGSLQLLSDQVRQSDIWFVANTREEGLGDLGGIRAVIDKLGSRLESCVILEGMAFGKIYTAGIAVRRLKISAQAAGGHSWLHFGQPNAIHTLVRFAARLTELSVPQVPRTTYNIGLIEGGHSVNSIATEASLTLDMRSEDPSALAALEKAVLACCEPNSSLRIEVVGDRPAGSIATTHPLANMARQTLEAIGAQPAFRSGSTDANLPLARGIPAITIGITHGGNAHRLDEYIDTDAVEQGMWQLLLLAFAASHSLNESA